MKSSLRVAAVMAVMMAATSGLQLPYETPFRPAPPPRDPAKDEERLRAAEDKRSRRQKKRARIASRQGSEGEV